MDSRWDMILTRMASKGPDGKFFPAYTGAESDEELRSIVVRFAQRGFLCHTRHECALRPMAGLTYVSLQNLANSMTRDTCLRILDAEWACRNFENGSNCMVSQFLPEIEN